MLVTDPGQHRATVKTSFRKIRSMGIGRLTCLLGDFTLMGTAPTITKHVWKATQHSEGVK